MCYQDNNQGKSLKEEAAVTHLVRCCQGRCAFPYTSHGQHNGECQRGNGVDKKYHETENGVPRVKELAVQVP